MSRWLLSCALLLCAGTCFADESKDLRLAAREGNLVEVRRLIDSGVPVDSADSWGTTALALAVGQNQIGVVDYLLKNGADASVREQFFGMSALDFALWKGAPTFDTARLLLAAGARDRASALAQAIETQDLALGSAAAASGPVTETEAADLRAQFEEYKKSAAADTDTGEDGTAAPSRAPGSDEMLENLLRALKTEKDPPPPGYSKKELAEFGGTFESGDGGIATIAPRKGGLTLKFEGDTYKLTPSAVRTFRDRSGDVIARYSGRANTVEGLTLRRTGQDPVRLRVADSPVVRNADLQESSRMLAKEPAAKESSDAPSNGSSKPTAPTVNWPGFRGPNRSGVGDGRDTPIDFNLETGEGVAWTAEIPGLGNSSPVVWGDRVYVTTAVAAGGSTPLRVGSTGSGEEVEEAVEHRWLVLAFDKSTGEKIWETEVGKGTPLTKRHFKATQANSSPVTDGEHIVVVFPTAGLACLGKDGSIHWKHELGGLNAGGFNDPGLQWGFAASPILHEGKAILQVDIHDGAYLAAWDLKTGKELWRTERPDVAPSWSTPAIWSTPKGDELVVNASVIRGYDPEDGKELWSLGPTSIQVVAAPVVGEKNLFVSSGYPPARPIYAVKPGIRGAHTIESDADADALAWYETRGGAYMPTPLLYRGLLYVVHHSGKFVAHDARTGAKVYQARFSGGGTCTGSPVAANGKFYQGTEEGTLYVVEAGGEHKELAVHEFGEPLMATPAISEGLLLVRTPSKLIALGVVPGQKRAWMKSSGEISPTRLGSGTRGIRNPHGLSSASGAASAFGKPEAQEIRNPRTTRATLQSRSTPDDRAEEKLGVGARWSTFTTTDERLPWIKKRFVRDTEGNHLVITAIIAPPDAEQGVATGTAASRAGKDAIVPTAATATGRATITIEHLESSESIEFKFDGDDFIVRKDDDRLSLPSYEVDRSPARLSPNWEAAGRGLIQSGSNRFHEAIENLVYLGCHRTPELHLDAHLLAMFLEPDCDTPTDLRGMDEEPDFYIGAQPGAFEREFGGRYEFPVQ